MVPLRLLHVSLHEHARQAPDRIAIADDVRAVTYGDLALRTGRLAGHLAEWGVRPGDRVAVLLPNQVAYVESMLAVLRAGAIGVPLDPRCADPELAQLLADCTPTVVITDQSHGSRVLRAAPHGRPPRLLLVGDTDTGSFEALAQAQPGQPARDTLPLDEPAWLLYTSGTTGRSKGVLSSQRAWLSSIEGSYRGLLGFSSADRVLWPLPLFHAFAHSMCLVGAVTVGATVRIMREFRADEALRLLREQRCTFLAGVPTSFQQLVSAAGERGLALPALRICLTGGAPGPAGLAESVQHRFGAELLDSYGSTETCGKISLNRPGADRVPGSCGQPAPGMEIRVVDPDTGLDRVSGDEGEIWVSGPGLMLGYYRRPEETARALVNGWYRTGDLGRWVAGDQLVITGRAGELIIRGGENIHPAEIERVLLGVPGVLDAAVAGAPHPVFGEVPVAYLVADAAGIEPTEVLAACRRELTAFKVPEQLYLVDALPRTASGKVVRRALAELPARPMSTVDTAAHARLSAELAGLSPAERDRRLLDLVRAELAGLLDSGSTESGSTDSGSIDPIPADRPFVELGVGSLAVLMLRDRLGAATGLDLPSTVFFDHPTPRVLAGHLLGRLLPTASAGRGTTTRPVADPGPLRATDPVVIVGMACRYPGDVASPDDLWRLVCSGTDATSDFPTDRGWHTEDLFADDPDQVGTSYLRRGGFLSRPADFDAAFFRIAPREALAMDPQQRLLLETSWEAVQRSGIAPDSLRGSDTGVFVGLMYSDYAARFTGIGHELEAYLALGSSGAVASGRIAYTLDLHGPTITVDTACSSSLVALHLATQSLLAGQCSLAITGGATVLATPGPFVAFSRQRALAPDGRCKPFSADSDGTVWAEGAAVVVLERLSDAVRNDHPVLAVVSGSAVNSDGASNGLTAPSGPAQRAVIRLALADAGLSAEDVDAVEAHGTGTPLGDPIEARALIETYGPAHTADHPLWIGSIKGNIGHTMAAAGLAGVIKMVQAMRHGHLPATHNVSAPTPHVDWSAGTVRLLTESTPWPASARPRRAGVSAFGIGGTNAHVVLTQPPEPAPRPAGTPLAIPLLLSGVDADGLRTQAGQLGELLRGRPELRQADVGFSLATTTSTLGSTLGSTLRSTLPYRAALFAEDRTGLLRSLDGLGSDLPDPDRLVSAAGQAGGLAVLFAGQGAQRTGMGRDLAERFPAFADAFDEVCQALDAHQKHPLREVLFGQSMAGLLDRTDYAQAGLFAFEVALYRLLTSWGIRPDYLVGHSIGEITAAHVAGVLCLPDAATLVAARGRLMRALPTGGAMVAVTATEDEVRAALADSPQQRGQIAVAAVNGPRAVVVSGAESAVLELAAEFAARGRRTARLRVSHAFHSALMEPMLADFRDVATGLSLRRPEVPVVSSVTGRPADDLDSPEYWVRQARQTVRFAAAVRWLADHGVTAFFECGPNTALTPHVEETLSAEGSSVCCVSSTRGDRDEATSLLAGLSALHVHGIDLPWAEVLRGSSARRVELPTQPFRRQRFWLEQPRPSASADRPVPVSVLAVPDTDRVVATGRLSLRAQPWLADHVLGGQLVVPGAVLVELAARVGEQVGRGSIAELVQHAPLVLPEHADLNLQLVLRGADARQRQPFDVYASTVDTDLAASWTRYASGVLAPATQPRDIEPIQWPPAAEWVDLTDRYAELAEAGLRYGPAFRGVTAVWRRGNEIFAELSPPSNADADEYCLHPTLLDAAVHAARLASDEQSPPRLPFSWEGVEHFRSGVTRARVRLVRGGADSMSATIVDSDSLLVATVRSLTTRPIAAESPPADALFQLEWRAIILPSTSDTPEFSRYRVRPAATDDPSARIHDTVCAVLDDVQAELAGSGRLAVVTQDATSTDPEPAGSVVWGLLSAAQSEDPHRLVLIDTDGRPESLAAVTAAIASGEPQVAIRSGIPTVPALRPARRNAENPRPMRFDPSGTVLITGGTGALGAITARHLVSEHGVRHLLLVSRSGPKAAGAEDLVTELRALGAEVRLVACDVGDRVELTELVGSCVPPIRGVVHTAGVLDDGVFAAMRPDRIETVLRPKLAAAWLLHELTADLELSAFVLFSSAAGLLGNAGQANYAAANAGLDALARHRAARGLPALSLAWGMWSPTKGMTTQVSDSSLGRLGRSGLLPIGPETGMALFDAALGLAEPVLAPMLLDRAALRARNGDLPAVLRDLVPSRRPARRVDSDRNGSDPRRLPAEQRTRFVLDLVRRTAAEVLGHRDASAVSADVAFTELGFDSLSAVDLRNRLAASTGVRLAPTAVFDHPSATALTTALVAELADPPATRPAPATLTSLYRKVCEAGQFVAAMHLVVTASWALPSFASADMAKHAVAPIGLATGPEHPMLVCLPSFAPSGPEGDYAALARSFQDERDLHVLPHPGYAAGKAVPDSRETLVRLHADAVQALVGDRPFVVVGRSTGGLVGHAVAERLRELNSAPVGLVLIDSYHIDQDNIDVEWLVALPGRNAHRFGESFAADEEAALAAMGAYTRFFLDWTPEPTGIPTLLVRATERTDRMPAENWSAAWPTPHESVSAPGNHFTLLEEHAASTAAAIRTWIAGLHT